MLEPRLLRRLGVEPHRHPRGQPHLSSASGLVVVGEHAYVVADDENHIARLSTRDIAAPLQLVRLAAGTLPRDAVQRKRTKGDFETLIHLPSMTQQSPGLLLAMGSGSRPQRERACVLALDEEGTVAAEAREVSTTALCLPLQQHLGELNIEGGFVEGERVHLLQRASRRQPRNACITYARTAFQDWLCGKSPLPPPPDAIAWIDLGTVAGVPLGITDATRALDGGWMFCAVAEDTDNAYDDGACVASVLGWVDERGQVQRCEALRGSPKVEGIAWVDSRRMWLVTDADDPSRASELLELAPGAGSPS
jgi:hypothetical protein